jgi:uncharacterized membrane protein YkvA (DUF1232 family)
VAGCKQKVITKKTWYRKLKRKAGKLKRQVWALSLCLKDPDTPFLARLVIAVAVAYAVSPIDLIPDFIPVLGMLDDLVILPALIALAIRMVPPAVMARCRRAAWKHLAGRDRVKTNAGIIASLVFVALWTGILALIVHALFIKR